MTAVTDRHSAQIFDTYQVTKPSMNTDCIEILLIFSESKGETNIRSM
jgi:hypothetical protein